METFLASGLNLIFLVIFPSPSSSSYSLSTSSQYVEPMSLRNISMYPVCIEDSDCENDRRCFQYMCYPWKTTSMFRWCSNEEDCLDLLPEEGGDSSPGSCFRHHDTTKINFGICLKKREMRKCSSHSDCPGGAAPMNRKGSLRCTNNWCGDPAYFKALKERSCYNDTDCEALLTGEMCCYDFSSPQRWQAGRNGQAWTKKCCNNPSGNPVIRPPSSISKSQLKQLDKRIRELSLLYMDMVVCESLQYSMMLNLTSCQEFTTTTTISPKKGHQTSHSVQHYLSIHLLSAVLTTMLLNRFY